MSSQVIVQDAGEVRRISINRPDRLNAITAELILEIVDAVESGAHTGSVRVMTITGVGRAFSAGADLMVADSADTVREGLPETATLDAVNRLAIAIWNAPKLVVALVNGPAVGVGSSLVLAADLAIASDTAYFKPGFEAIGLMPDGGGTVFLPAAVGRSRALAIYLLGDRLSAEQAHAAGIFARVFPAAEFIARSDQLVKDLALGATRAQAAAKRGVNLAAVPNLHSGLEFEREHQRELMASADFDEGVAAFVAKRSPRFTGR